MRLLVLASLAVMSVTCVGCSASYNWRESAPAANKLTGKSAYVAVPANGRFENTVYDASGEQTADALVEAARPHLERVERGKQSETAEEAVEHARAAGFDYVIQPTILHWEDRATEWSGRPDRIEIRVDIVEVATGATVATNTLSAKSKWATFGGDHPQDLLPNPFGEHMATLF